MKKTIAFLFTIMMLSGSALSYAQCTEGTKPDANGDCIPETNTSTGVRG